jgi:hypothetical protein
VVYQYKIDRFIFPSFSHCEQLWSNKGISSSCPGCRGRCQRQPWRLVLRQKQLGLWVYLKIIIESIESLGFLAFWCGTWWWTNAFRGILFSNIFGQISLLKPDRLDEEICQIYQRESTGRWHLCSDGCINTALENSNTTGPKSSCAKLESPFFNRLKLDGLGYCSTCSTFARLGRWTSLHWQRPRPQGDSWVMLSCCHGQCPSHPWLLEESEKSEKSEDFPNRSQLRSWSNGPFAKNCKAPNWGAGYLPAQEGKSLLQRQHVLTKQDQNHRIILDPKTKSPPAQSK